MSKEVASGAIAKILPTGSVAVASVMGLPLQEWTYVVAIFVGITQVIHTCYCIYRKWKDTPPLVPPLVPPTQQSNEDSV